MQQSKRGFWVATGDADSADEGVPEGISGEGVVFLGMGNELLCFFELMGFKKGAGDQGMGPGVDVDGIGGDLGKYLED